ncbi:hypothetical protein [Brevibacillus laterosporus]|uniref:hypothetical protein n=1 Tax=Brevibacillus laterosporus TaxID=1465 RepID=UPI003D22BD80
MSFADMVGSLLQGLGNLLASFFQFLLKPISYLLQFFDGVFYFFYKLFVILAQILHLFLALLQALWAVTAGIFRTITSFLSWSGGSFHSKIGNEGITLFVEMVEPYGILNVLPYILLALHVLVTGYLILKIIGGRR